MTAASVRLLDTSPLDTLPHRSGSPSRREHAQRLDQLQHLIEHASHYLPAQGPISVFIHHNTLHAFEDLPFHEGVKRGARLFGCQPYLSEDAYRQKLALGQIRVEDLVAALLEDLGEDADRLVGFMGTRFHFRLAMLQYPWRIAPSAELRWFVAETDALRKMREETPPEVRQEFISQTRRWVMRDIVPQADDPAAGAAGDGKRRHGDLAGLLAGLGGSPGQWSDEKWEAFALQALWRVCREGVHGMKPAPPVHPTGVRHRDLLLEATGRDSDQLVHDLLIPFCAAFLDQGFARWPLPLREEGFFRAFSNLFYLEGGPPELWLEDLPSELARLAQAQMTPLESILESLELLGVPPAEWDEFIAATLLALRGWAGMIQQVEKRADSVVHPVPQGSLVEFLAVRLILDRLAAAWVAKDAFGKEVPLSELRHVCRSAAPKHDSVGVDQRAFLVFQLAQVLGWLPEHLASLSKEEWTRLVAEIEAFPALERRRIFHAALERKYRMDTLDAISVHGRQAAARLQRPLFQIVCCIDEREESFRRHLEEVAPQCETFGAAGFFNVAIYYRGAADAHFVPLCPIVIRPQHWVTEEALFTFEELHRRRARARRTLGAVSHQVHVGSRTFLGGAMTAALGVLATIPLVARVLVPRQAARIRRLASRFVSPPPLTQLELERSQPQAGPQSGHVGFTVEEMTAIVERLLRDLGLTSGFARLVIIVGHGSSSLNNPHESAHDCGACGGGRGGPNARAFARMANDPRVRERLAAKGLAVPADTVFLGSYHNTCDESLTFFDLDRLPLSHKSDYEAAERALREARRRNAHERCRRFESAPLTLSFEAALRHVEARAEDLSQTRPEYGHATNAICIVGRRERTRGLFLDRRAFLTSYDPQQDDSEATILTRLLQAVVPVCAGINLEYYFSFVDPTGWGCGTKLPHNITSLLGVMDGAASDLRPGLPWQMVEIHEPVRLLMIVETTPQTMLRIMERNAGIGRLIRNGWVQLAVLDPRSPRIDEFREGRFHPYRPQISRLPTVACSADWYRGWREHLGYAVVEGANPKDH